MVCNCRSDAGLLTVRPETGGFGGRANLGRKDGDDLLLHRDTKEIENEGRVS